MLMRYDPFRELDRLAQQVWRAPVTAPSAPMDAYRRGDRFVVEFDLPGVDPGSIDLTVDKNVLTVRASRERRTAEGDEVLVAERPYGEFTRQLFLGDTLDTDDIAADYDQGVLTLMLTVAEKAKPRKVEIAKGGRQDSEATKQLSGSAS